MDVLDVLVSGGREGQRDADSGQETSPPIGTSIVGNVEK